jgi:hypothetical protein
MTTAAVNNARKAADKQKKQQKKAKKSIRAGERKATVALDEAQATGTAALERGETKGIEAIQQAVDTGRQDITAGKDEGIGYIDQGVQEAVAKDQAALDLYTPLAQQANAGADKYGNFYGLGGQEGYDQAKQDWQSSVQYDAMTGEGAMGNQALQRQAAARGNPYNATDVMAYNTDLANRHVNDYIGGLRPYLDQQGQYANAQANIYGNMGNRLYGGGIAQGNMAYGAGGALAGQGMQGGLAQGQMYGNTASNLSNLAQGIGQTQATGVNMPAGMGVAQVQQNMGQTEADMYANITAAQNADAQNKWGMINAGIGALGTLGGAYLGQANKIG